MTPLIDVMLVLLVIFIITAPLMTSSLKLDLPKTDAAQPSDTPLFITVALDRDGRYFYGDEAVDAAPSPPASVPPRSAMPRPRSSCAPTRRCRTDVSPSSSASSRRRD